MPEKFKCVTGRECPWQVSGTTLGVSAKVKIYRAVANMPDSELAITSLLTKHDPNPGTLDPRPYQIELFERAKVQNTIAVLDTGKSYISSIVLGTDPFLSYNSTTCLALRLLRGTILRLSWRSWYRSSRSWTEDDEACER